MTNSIDLHVGQRVRALRLAAALSTQHVAHALGLSAEAYKARENGIERLSAGQLFDLARLFRVAIGSFFEGLPHTAATAHKAAE